MTDTEENLMDHNAVPDLRNLISLMEERATLLNMALDTGTYTDGYERTLADEIVRRLNATERGDAIDYFVHARLLDLVTVLLDECATESYEVVQQAADIFTAAVHAEGDTHNVLHRLITTAIDTHARLDRTIAGMQ